LKASFFYGYKALVRNLCAHVGLRPYRRPDALVKLLRLHDVHVVLDVGANAGQFGRRIRSMGYRKSIVSFEPLEHAFRKLAANTAMIPQWCAVHLALGDVDETRSINVAGNSQSSSFLDMLPQHVSAAPKSAYVGAEIVNVRRLDGIFGDYCRPHDRCFLKIDVQGFEEAVLRGAERSLERCMGLQLELSVLPLYRGGLMLPEMLTKLADLGFALMDLQPGFSDPHTHELLQIDGTFFRHASNSTK